MIIRCPRTVRRSACSPDAIANIFRAILSAESDIDQEKEHFWAMGLDTQNKIKYLELVTLGILDASLVHPRETYRMAIAEGASRIVVAHNHPSGVVTPSREDYEVTKRLREAGKVLGIELLDHIVIGPDDFASIRTNRPELFM